MNDHLKHLVIYWHNKGLDASTIYEKCNKNFGTNVAHYSTITDWLRKLNRGESILIKKSGGSITRFDFLDPLICQQLEEMPFHSLRTLSTALKVPKSTIYDHMIKMGFVVKHLRYVPHTLSIPQKQERVRISKLLLSTIKNARHQSWKYFLTGDESWFYFSTDYENQWLQPDQKPLKRPRKIISTPKRMFTIFWSPLGFRIVEMLPHGSKFNSEYFIDNILEQIVQTNPSNQKRKFVIHMDNATPHRSKMTQKFASDNGLFFCEHPPFSPDLAPSDFYLFGMIKGALKGQTFSSEEELLNAIKDVLDGITRKDLEKVINDWELRLQACIDKDGDYIE